MITQMFDYIVVNLLLLLSVNVVFYPQSTLWQHYIDKLVELSCLNVFS